jgi:hypothetical protein
LDIERAIATRTDFRLLMEWDRPYPRINHPDICVTCAGRGDRTKRLDLLTTRRRAANAPLGRLMSRCPAHQAEWERTNAPTPPPPAATKPMTAAQWEEIALDPRCGQIEQMQRVLLARAERIDRLGLDEATPAERAYAAMAGYVPGTDWIAAYGQGTPAVAK